MALAVVLFFYGASSEVVWLYLLAYWVVALVAASFFYAAWNHGYSLEGQVVGWVRLKDTLPAEIPHDLARDEYFEGDRVRMRVTLGSPRTTRGPAKATGMVGVNSITFAAGVVRKTAGHTERPLLPPVTRGPLHAAEWRVESADPLGLFQMTELGREGDVALVLPRFASLRAQPLVRELEASVTAPRAGSGTEVFGVREYRPGDPLRRIHWRTTARRGELMVREFEPPGVQNLGIFLDSNPIDPAGADQCARLAASEAWDCLRAGGRVTLWAPGCEPTRPDEERNLLALLQWLARYPHLPKDSVKWPPSVGAAVAITTRSEATLLDAIDEVRARGGPVRAWVVGDAVLAGDIEVEHAGLEWPL